MTDTGLLVPVVFHSGHPENFLGALLNYPAVTDIDRFSFVLSERIARKSSSTELVVRSEKTIFADILRFYSLDGFAFATRFNGNLDGHCVPPYIGPDHGSLPGGQH